ncbi:MAG TPA: 50S ribosomal protein L29 [Candidatus Paceibacterota bacterium]|jgi:ribosomal protein L29|nr:50S ribosomal protein L29 [Candidatus Paceibacterota bacterium]
MAKKESYNGKSMEALNGELDKLRGSLRSLETEKLKTGKAKDFRTARKNIARVRTAINAQVDKRA